MKKLLILLFSILISFNSYGEWTYVSSNVSGDDFYVVLDKIKNQDGSTYFWYLTNYYKKDKFGNLSDITFTEGNCIMSGYRWLTVHYYSALMAKGKLTSTDNDISKWRYPPPNSVMAVVLESVCDYAN